MAEQQSAPPTSDAALPGKGIGQMRFVPLEANPELMTDLAHKLGLSRQLSFVDVYSLKDPDLLAFIPRPCHALLLVFPVDPEYEAGRVSEDKTLDQQTLDYGKGGVDEPLWIKQTIRNACGLMAMLHAVLNGTARRFIEPQTTLAELLAQAKPLDAESRAKLLERDDSMARSYGEVAEQGDTPAPSAADDVDLHYVCFVKDTPTASDGGGPKTSRLWELDGRRLGPLKRADGLTEQDDVLCPEALAKGPLKFLESGGKRDLRFSCVALVEDSG